MAVIDTCDSIKIATDYVLTCDHLAFIHKISHERTHMKIKGDEVW
jgi:hypothetical protein